MCRPPSSMTERPTAVQPSQKTQRKRWFGGLDQIFPTSAIHRKLLLPNENDCMLLSAAVIYKVLHPSFKKPGYHRPFSFHFFAHLAGRPDSSVNLCKWGRAAFGRGEHFSSSTVESRRSGPTFLSLCLRLRECNLVCLLYGGFDDLLLLGREGGCELSVKLRLRLRQSCERELSAHVPQRSSMSQSGTYIEGQP